MVLFLITVTLIASYSYYQNKRALTQFSHDYVSKYAESLVNTIEIRMWEPLESSHLVTLWLPPIKSLKEIKAEQIVYLKNLLKIFSTLSGFHFSLENGDFLHFHTVSEGDVFQTKPTEKLPLNTEYCIVSITHENDKPQEIWEYYNKNDRIITQEIIPIPSYDARLKEWYGEAKRKKGLYISPDVELGKFIKNLVITSSRPFLDAHKNV